MQIIIIKPFFNAVSLVTQANDEFIKAKIRIDLHYVP